MAELTGGNNFLDREKRAPCRAKQRLIEMLRPEDFHIAIGIGSRGMHQANIEWQCPHCLEGFARPCIIEVAHGARLLINLRCGSGSQGP